MKLFSILLFLIFTFTVQAQIKAPEPCGPVPTEQQIEWHNLNFYAFIHFGTNTYVDTDWGYGDADPDIFCPTEFDVEQWVKALKKAGMKGVVITTKHHDGFCLWPSQYTDYSVKNSKWMNGKGDVVGTLAKAAKKHGLKFGVYLSPWDRHDLRYGTADYIEYYRNQVKELLTQYGPVFEFWPDGANGGDGFYGGRKEKRVIDSKTYYDWSNTNALIKQLQPKIDIHAGTDSRWCGNEKGYVGETNWCTSTRYWPGNANHDKVHYGEENGVDWLPAEVDVSIRPSWFYRESENSEVKTVSELLKIYYESIGRGANLILNIPPNRQGLFSPEDLSSLEGLGIALKQEFGNCKNNLIKYAEASNTRGGDKQFGVKNSYDKNCNSYWTTDDDVKNASITYTMKKPTLINRAKICEYIRLGQRVKSFSLEFQDENGNWSTIATGTTIGFKRLLRFKDVTTRAIRLTIVDSKACPVISDVQFYASPLKFN